MAVWVTGGPDFTLEIAPGESVLDPSPTWAELALRVLAGRGLSCERGRSRESEQANAGRLSFTADNADRELDPTNTTSSYYVGGKHQIRKRLPVRLTATYNAVSYDVWRGHVTDVEQLYADAEGGLHETRFDCTDLFEVMATVNVSERSAWASTVEKLQPLAWWRLGEEAMGSGVAATDEGGRYDGFYAGDTATPADSLVDGDQSGAMATGANGYVVLPGQVVTDVSTQNENTLIGRFSSGTVGSANRYVFTFAYTIAAPPGGLDGQLDLYIEATTGKLALTDGTLTATSSGRVDDGQPHTFAVVSRLVGSSELFLDGASVGTVFGEMYDPGIANRVNGVWLGIRGANASGVFNGTIDDVALFPQELTSTQLGDLHDAAADSWAGDTTGARIGRAAALAGIPSGLLDLDTGASTVTGWTGGSSTLDVAQEAAATEQGVFVVAEDGTLTFLDRPALLNRASSATFGDSGSDLTYAGFDYEWGTIVNRATFTSEAGSASAEDTDSLDEYGIHDARRTTTDNNRDNLLHGAQALVTRYAQPDQRITALTIDPSIDPTNLWPQVLGRQIGDRITVKRSFTFGSAISEDLTIIGVKHAVSDSGWRTTWNLSDADTGTYLVLDDATLGQLDAGNRLAF